MKIKVYDDENELVRFPEDHVEVDAECVDGKEGILAFFEYDSMFCIASGDDGFWHLIYNCAMSWETLIFEGFKTFYRRTER